MNVENIYKWVLVSPFCIQSLHTYLDGATRVTNQLLLVRLCNNKNADKSSELPIANLRYFVQVQRIEFGYLFFCRPRLLTQISGIDAMLVAPLKEIRTTTERQHISML